MEFSCDAADAIADNVENTVFGTSECKNGGNQTYESKMRRYPKNFVVLAEEKTEDPAVSLAIISYELVGVEESEAFKNLDPKSQTDRWGILRIDRLKSNDPALALPFHSIFEFVKQPENIALNISIASEPVLSFTNFVAPETEDDAMVAWFRARIVDVDHAAFNVVVRSKTETLPGYILECLKVQLDAVRHGRWASESACYKNGASKLHFSTSSITTDAEECVSDISGTIHIELARSEFFEKSVDDIVKFFPEFATRVYGKVVGTTARARFVTTDQVP